MARGTEEAMEGAGPSPARPGGGRGSASDLVGTRMELVTGTIAAGGGCVARADDGRVVFVRHALPDERVVAEVTGETTSFLRADAVEVVEPSSDRVAPPCPHAGPGRCGGCDYQHVALPAQRGLKSSLVGEQLRRLAGVDGEVEVEEVEGAPTGLGWRTRVRFAVDRSGQVGFRRHRSHDIEVLDQCPIATSAVNGVAVGSSLWRGAHHVEVTAPPGGGPPVVAVETGRNRLAGRPVVDAGLVVDGRVLRRPGRTRFEVLGHRFEVSPGVFWQVHPGAAAVLTECVLEGLAPKAGERVADLYSGAGLFTVPLARAVGPRGAVVAMERNGRACADAVHNAADLHQVTIVRSEVNPSAIRRHLGSPDLVVLDPSREGAGVATMRALAGMDPSPRRIAYVACDPASFARDLRAMTDLGWALGSLRAFDLFPMTEHVELVAMLDPPSVS